MKRISSNDSDNTGVALAIIKRLRRRTSKTEAVFAKARVNASVAQLILEAREKAALTQKELAEMIGTRQPVIARLENAKYTGHSLTLLQRIATALNQRLEITLTPRALARDEESQG